MARTRQLNSTDLFMREYIMWGGPIITRMDALRDAQRMALPQGAIDAAVFGARAVEAPDDPEWHRDFLARIRAQEEARKPEVKAGRVIVTLSNERPAYSSLTPRQSNDVHRPITMRELDRKIAHAAKRHHERANAYRRKRPKPYRRPEYTEIPKGWTLID